MRKYSIAPMLNFPSVQFRCVRVNSVFPKVKRHSQHKQKTQAFKEPYQIRGLTCFRPSSDSGSFLRKRSSLLGSSSFLLPPNRCQRRIKRLFVRKARRTLGHKGMCGNRDGLFRALVPLRLVWALNGADMMDN